jgi:pimeloyl-ACP methyl ester carboxylesterase
MLEDARGSIDFDETGSGPTIVFVPGSWSTRTAWRSVTAPLSGRFRVVTTSLLGYGGTQERRTATNTTIEQQAEIVEAVVQQTMGSVHLVGHSYGGLVCLPVVMRGTANVISLTLIEPVAFDLLRQVGDLPLHQEFTEARERYFLAFGQGDKRAARLMVDYLGGHRSFDALPPRMQDYIMETTPTHVLDMQSDFYPPLSAYQGISLPALVVRGGLSHPALARSAEILSRVLPNASLAGIAGASHFMISTHPEDVAGLIGEHCTKADPLLPAASSRRVASASNRD